MGVNGIKKIQPTVDTVSQLNKQPVKIY